MLATMLLAAALAAGSSSPARGATPEEAARAFFSMYVKRGEAVGNLDGLRVLTPFLSQRLLAVLQDASACQKDWRRQQPKDSTDKPPFVDCCLFASSPEGVPTAFALGPTEHLADRRYRVFVDFTHKDRPGTYSDRKIPLQTSRWREAVIVALEAGHYKIDDFLFMRDSPESPLPLSKSFDGCRGPRWIEQDQAAP